MCTIFFTCYGTLCIKGEESYCDMFTSEIMATGVSPNVICIDYFFEIVSSNHDFFLQYCIVGVCILMAG